MKFMGLKPDEYLTLVAIALLILAVIGVVKSCDDDTQEPQSQQLQTEH